MIQKLKKLSPKLVAEILLRGVNFGFCPLCERKTLFYKKAEGLRDNYHCVRCNSIPRQRALFQVLKDYVPDWRSLKIHESSPSGATLKKFLAECSAYTGSQYFPDKAMGTLIESFRNEDLSKQTFKDDEFDLVITQDVLEHLLDPIQAFKEISRTLKPGGLHVFTVPWYYWQDTKIRARVCNDEVVHIEPPDFHVNPVDDKGSLVVTEWGGDLVDTIYASTGMTTTIIRIRDRNKGIEADFIEIFLSKKPHSQNAGLDTRWRVNQNSCRN